jgi:hypothetical protein
VNPIQKPHPPGVQQFNHTPHARPHHTHHHCPPVRATAAAWRTAAAVQTTTWRSHRRPPLGGGGASHPLVRGGAAVHPLTIHTPPSYMPPPLPVGDELDHCHPQVALTTAPGDLSPTPPRNHRHRRRPHHTQCSSPPTLIRRHARCARPVSRTPSPVTSIAIFLGLCISEIG